jgi:hypothetical protein
MAVAVVGMKSWPLLEALSQTLGDFTTHWGMCINGQLIVGILITTVLQTMAEHGMSQVAANAWSEEALL